MAGNRTTDSRETGRARTRATRGSRAGAQEPLETLEPVVFTADDAAAYSAGSYPNKRRNRKKRNIWTIVFWVCLVIFVGCAIAAGWIILSYAKGESVYEDIQKEVLQLPEEQKALTLDELKVDWDQLKDINPEVVAWMYAPGTDFINYPVAWSGDNDKYLHRTFDGSPNGAVTYGTIFLQGEDEPDFSCENNVIYGHAMKNGTMFGAYYRMAWNGTFNTFRDIYWLTPEGNLHLRTFAFVHVRATDLKIMTTDFDSDEERTKFIQDKIDRSMFKTDDEIPAAADMEKVFSFVTCDSATGAGRYVIYAYVYTSTIPGIEGLGVLDPNAGGDISGEMAGNLDR